MATIDGVRALALTLPRSYEALVRDRVKFRVGRIVYLAFSRDEKQMGFAFPKWEREGLVKSEPHKFLMPSKGDMRYHWVEVRIEAIDDEEMREIVLDAWRMVVPKRVAREFLGDGDWDPDPGPGAGAARASTAHPGATPGSLRRADRAETRDRRPPRSIRPEPPG